MKKIRMILILMVVFALCVSVAHAGELLSASIKDGRMVINWQVDCTGTAQLSVYENNWPIEVRYVNCDDGEAIVNLGRNGGKYSVRLRTDTVCLTAGVTSVANTPNADATHMPSATKKPANTWVPPVTATPNPTINTTSTPKPTLSINHTPAPTAIVTAVPDANTGTNQSGLAWQVVEQVNAERAKYGLSTLRMDSELTRAAQVRAAEIVQKFSHTRPDGSSWSTVSKSAYGENIAKGQKTADKVMAAWLTSEGHRANILKAGYGSIGVCAYIYNGVTYWVQLFGK